MYDLVVTREFGSHFVGERITDRAAVDDILANHNASYCVKVPAEEKAPASAKPETPSAASDEDAGKGLTKK